MDSPKENDVLLGRILSASTSASARPSGIPSLPPRKPVVQLLQLGTPTLCLRKRTPQSHLLCVELCVGLCVG